METMRLKRHAMTLPTYEKCVVGSNAFVLEVLISQTKLVDARTTTRLINDSGIGSVSNYG